MSELKASLKHILLFGFLVWLIPLVISFLIYPIQQQNPGLFSTVMTIILVSVTAVFGLLLQKKTKFPMFLAVLVGFLWVALSWLLDYLILVRGPIQMPLNRYVVEVGLEYLIIPILVFAFSIQNSQEKENS